jgi:hypothetical protein
VLEKIDTLLSLVGEHEFVGGSRERTMVTALETGSGVLTLLMDCPGQAAEVRLPLAVALKARQEAYAAPGHVQLHVCKPVL